MMQNTFQPQTRPSGLNWFQKILLILMTLLAIACISVVAILYFGYSIPGVKVPAYLSFLLPPPTATPVPYYTATITLTYTNTPITTPTNTRTAIPTYTLLPTRTKAPTWTLVPMLITPAATLTPEPGSESLTGTPPTATFTPTP